MAVFLSDDSLVVREVTSDDVQSILAIYGDSEDFLALGPEPRASVVMVLKDIETSHKESGHFCGINNPDGKMVGIIDFIPEGFSGQGHEAYISLLIIARPYRGQGIGSRIVKIIEEEVNRHHHAISIHTSVQINNPDALRFWTKNGYGITGGPELQPDQTRVFHLIKALG